MLFRVATVIAVIALAGTVASSADASVEGKTIEIFQEIYDEHGDPTLNASTSGNEVPLAWERCLPPLSTCSAIGGSGSFIDAGETPAGTTFTVRRAGIKNTEVVTSHTWGGRLTNTAPPRVMGDLLVMSRLTLAPGDWTGGWPGDTDAVTVFACRYLNSKTCEVVTGAWYPNGSQPVNRPIGVKFAGWHLIAVDYRNEVDALYTMEGLGPVRWNPLRLRQATIAMREIGRVAPSPNFDVSVPSKTALSRADRFRLASVRCSATCTVVAQMGFSRAGIGWSRQAKYKISGREIIRPRWRRLSPGDRLHYSLSIDDASLADGILRLRR